MNTDKCEVCDGAAADEIRVVRHCLCRRCADRLEAVNAAALRTKWYKEEWMLAYGPAYRVKP